jgi:hypothetical protein
MSIPLLFSHANNDQRLGEYPWHAIQELAASNRPIECNRRALHKHKTGVPRYERAPMISADAIHVRERIQPQHECVCSGGHSSAAIAHINYSRRQGNRTLASSG